MKNPEKMTLNEWAAALDEYKATPGFRPGAAMRIEDTPFTSARRAGGMRYGGDMYTYFEPEVDGHAPNEDGTPYVAWLMVREDFLRWVAKRKKEGRTAAARQDKDGAGTWTLPGIGEAKVVG